MPRIDINFEPVPQVAPTEAPQNDYFHIQANPAAFGAPVAQGMEKLGQGMEHSAEEGFNALEFHDKVSADYEVNNFIDARTKAEYGDPNKTVMGPDGQPARDTGYFGLSGRAALDARQPALEAIQQARQRGLDNLQSPRARLLYDTETRRMFTDSQMRISAHADQQQKMWAQGVNATGADLNLNGYAATIVDHPDAADDYYHRYIDAKVKNAQLRFGNDPQIVQDVISGAKRDLLVTQLNAVAVKDPAAARALLDKPENKALAGDKYDDISTHLRQRAETQTGITKANQYVMAANGPAGASMVAAHKGEAATAATTAWRNAGMSQNGIAGVMFNINEESGFNPTLRHPDQPRFAPDDERHYAHGLYQEGAEEWARYDGWLKANHPGADWRDPQLQSEFAAWNLKTNYPGTWERMNAASTPEQAAAIYAREYLKPAAANLQSRLAKIGQGVAPAVYTQTGAVAPSAVPSPVAPGEPTLADRLGAALRSAISDPDMNDRERDIAVRAIESQFRTLEITENQNAKAKKDASDNAAGGYISEITNGLHSPGFDFVALEGRINRDPNLNWEAKAHLLDRVAKFSGEEERISYGPGFFDAKSRILSSPGTPGHIGSVDDILNLPANAITRQGEHELVNVFSLSKREDQGALQEAKHAAESAVKLKMVRPEDAGGFVKDMKGEQLFNGRFLPMFNQEYNKWVKDGKDPFEFLRDEKKINGLMEMAYPKKDRDRDAVFARGDAEAEKGAPSEPLPPTPEGVNPAGWVPIVGAPPITASGKPWPLQNWAKVLQKLRDDPSQENKTAFKEKFNLDPDAVLEKFKVQEAPPEPAAAAMPAVEQPTQSEFAREQQDPNNPAVRFRHSLETFMHPETAHEKRHPEDVR